MTRHEITHDLHVFRDLMARWRNKVHLGNLAKLGYSQSRYTGLMGGQMGGLWSDPVSQLDEEVLLWEQFFDLPAVEPVRGRRHAISGHRVGMHHAGREAGRAAAHRGPARSDRSPSVRAGRRCPPRRS